MFSLFFMLVYINLKRLSLKFKKKIPVLKKNLDMFQKNGCFG